jgi:hypothetical protein
LLADNYSSEPLTANTTYSGGGFFYAASSQTIAFLVGAGGPFQYCAIGPEWDWCPISVNTGPTPGNTILLLKGINTGVSDTFYTAGVSVFLPGQSAGYYATGGTPVSVPAFDYSVPLAQNFEAVTFSSIIDSGITPSTLPICPDGTGGAFTTTGCGSLSTTYSQAWTPTAVTASTCAEQTLTVTGLATTQGVSVNPPAAFSHVWIGSARVSATNTLAVLFCGDATGGTPPSGNYLVVAH